MDVTDDYYSEMIEVLKKVGIRLPRVCLPDPMDIERALDVMLLSGLPNG